MFYTIRKKGFSLPGVVNGGGAMFLGDVFVGRFGCFKAAIGCMQKTVAVGSSSRKKKNNTSASTTGGVEVGGGGVGGGGDRRGGIVSKFFSRFSPKVAPEVSPSLNNGSGGGISSSSSSSSSLSSSSSPVDTVCSGFGDNKHLTASEKETYGIMPSEYEISCNNMNNNNNNIIISSETQLVEADDDSVVIRVNFGTHDFAYFEANMGLNDPDPPPSLYSRKSPLRSQNRSPPIYSADESNSTTTTTTDVSVPSPGGLLQFDESVISIPPPLYFPSRQDSPGG